MISIYSYEYVQEGLNWKEIGTSTKEHLFNRPQTPSPAARHGVARVAHS